MEKGEEEEWERSDPKVFFFLESDRRKGDGNNNSDGSSSAFSLFPLSGSLGRAEREMQGRKRVKGVEERAEADANPVALTALSLYVCVRSLSLSRLPTTHPTLGEKRRRSWEHCIYQRERTETTETEESTVSDSELAAAASVSKGGTGRIDCFYCGCRRLPLILTPDRLQSEYLTEQKSTCFRIWFTWLFRHRASCCPLMKIAGRRGKHCAISGQQTHAGSDGRAAE